mgnify:CR=1
MKDLRFAVDGCEICHQDYIHKHGACKRCYDKGYRVALNARGMERILMMEEEE